MKKITAILFILFTTIVFAQNITLKELVSFKTKSISLTQQALKVKNYSFLKTSNLGTQWKASDDSGIIGSNGNGFVLFMTYRSSLNKNILNEIKNSSYKYMGKSTKDNLEVDSYMKGDITILLSEMRNPEDGRILFSITIN